MKGPRLLILGAGPAGLATAYYGVQAGYICRLFEKESSSGGLCRTVKSGAHRYDLGAHRFHDRDPEVTAEVTRLLKGQIRIVDAPSRIYRWGRFIDFPPSPLNLLKSVPPLKGLSMASDFLRARLNRRPVETFKDYAINRFGKALADALLIDYSEKLWGLPAEQLSPTIATRRLSGMTLRSLAVELIAGSGKSQHLDGWFLYPTEGYGAIVEAIAGALPSGCIQTGAAVSRLEHCGGRITAIIYSSRRQTVEENDHVICSLPLSLLVRLFRPALEGELLETARAIRSRHIRLLYLRLSQPHFSEQATIYISDPDICVTRVTEPKNRSPRMAPPEETGIAVEIPCFQGDSLHQLSEEALTRRVISELKSIRLLDPSLVMGWEHRFLPNAYPTYDLQFRPRVERILNGLEQFRNLRIVGRQGLFFYSHLHDQMRMGRDLVSVLAAA